MNDKYNDYCEEYDMSDFPYNSMVSSKTPLELFEELKKYTPKIYETNVRHKIKSNKPLTYGKEKYIYVKSHKYMKMDVITDWFTQPQRIRSRKIYDSKSPYKVWRESGKYDEFKSNLKNYTKLELIKETKNTFFGNEKHVSTFRPSWMKGILSKLLEQLKTDTDVNNLSILDPCMGWGDRLITIISMGWNYDGYDPNIKLESAYKKIIETYGDKNKHKYVINAFEKEEVKKDYYDIVITSPPFYDLEIYDEDPNTNKNQSINNHKTYKEWKKNFLEVMLCKLMEGLKSGGIVCIHIYDYDGKRMVNYIHKYYTKRDDNEYIGVIGIKGGNKLTPCWCWRKK